MFLSPHPALCCCLASSKGSGEWEEGDDQKKGQNTTGGAEGGGGGGRTHLKKRGSNTSREAREEESVRERGREGAERVTSYRAASAHGAGEKLWESKQLRRIPIRFSATCSPRRGDRKDDWTGAGSVVTQLGFMGGCRD